jgi:hypothetical protein
MMKLRFPGRFVPGVALGSARGTLALLAACTTGVIPASAQDGNLHVLVITGLSGEPSFAASFTTAGGALIEAACGPWGVNDSSVVWLAEDPARDRQRIGGRATRGAIDTAFAQLAARSKRGDVIAVILIGHGSSQGADSRLSIPGADPTAADYSRWLDRFAGRTVVAVVAASGSGDFLPVLARPGRIVITATRSSTERNESYFGSRFAHGLASLEADADKDGRVSVLEAFGYAQREVAAAYQADGRLQTEHAQLDDDGDGRGTATPGSDGTTDGVLARRVTFGKAAAVNDPRVAALLTERRELETQVEALRRRKDSMAEAAYLAELERLLVAIAERTQAIRAASAERRP